MNKLFMVLGIVLVVAVIALSVNNQLGGIISRDEIERVAGISAQKEDTVNWKTYEGGTFSVKYPPSFTVNQGTTIPSPEYPRQFPTVAFINTDTQQNGVIIQISVADNSLSLNPDNALGKGPWLRYIDTFLEGKDIKRLSVDGEDAVMVEEIAAGQAGSITDLIMFNGDKIYQINMDPVTEESLETFRIMLSTFTFKE